MKIVKWFKRLEEKIMVLFGATKIDIELHRLRRKIKEGKSKLLELDKNISNCDRYDEYYYFMKQWELEEKQGRRWEMEKSLVKRKQNIYLVEKNK